MSTRTRLALVTGAASGLGKAFAESCARRGYNLLLADLPGTGLPALAEGLRREAGVEVSLFEADLSTAQGREGLASFCAERAEALDLLINNVGIYRNGAFVESPADWHEACVSLAALLPMRLVHELSPRLAKARGRVINVASLASFYPMPVMASYAASKAFLLHWGIAVAEELKPLGIGFTTVCPGGIYSNPSVTRSIESQGFLGRLSSVAPERLAERSLDAALKGRELYVPGAFNVLLAAIGSRLPKVGLARAIGARWRACVGKELLVKEPRKRLAPLTLEG
jgi:hypothetical protein